MAGPSRDADAAQQRWEIENEVETIPPCDEIFRYDAQEQQQFLAARKYIDSMIHCLKIQIDILYLAKNLSD